MIVGGLVLALAACSRSGASDGAAPASLCADGGSTDDGTQPDAPAPAEVVPEPDAEDCHTEESVWSGTIGELPIVMQLRRCGNRVGGRYYYHNRSESLLLVGSMEKGSMDLNLVEVEIQDGKPLVKTGANLTGLAELGVEGNIEGTWRQGDESLPWRAFRLTTGTYDTARTTRGSIRHASDKAFA